VPRLRTDLFPTLHTEVRRPESDWILTHGAFEKLVDQGTFAATQGILLQRTFNKSDEELLDNLRLLLSREGRLSLRLVKDTPGMASPSTYRARFGSLRRAYQLIGYGCPKQFGPIDLRRRTQALREELIATLATLFPNELSVVRLGGRWRSRLRLRSRLIVSVLVARSTRAWRETVQWRIDPVRHERQYVTLLARLDNESRAFLDFHVLPNIDRPRRFHISLTDSWLKRGMRLEALSAFCALAGEVKRNKGVVPQGGPTGEGQ
jgi:hypothetical protein